MLELSNLRGKLFVDPSTGLELVPLFHLWQHRLHKVQRPRPLGQLDYNVYYSQGGSFLFEGLIYRTYTLSAIINKEGNKGKVHLSESSHSETFVEYSFVVTCIINLILYPT